MLQKKDEAIHKLLTTWFHEILNSEFSRNFSGNEIVLTKQQPNNN